MTCPKCGADLADGAVECVRCGIVIARYLERHNSPPPFSAVTDLQAPGVGFAPSTALAVAVARGVFIALLAVWTTMLVGSVNALRVNSSFLHLPNLVFHEAGHILFLPFGRFMTVLGGSLTQVLVPLVCAGAFLWQTRDPFGAAVAVWWTGENLLDLAPYINDARDLNLVLLGGKTGAEVEGHDWEYLLNAMGLAQRDHAIANAVQAMGTITMVGALCWGAVVVLRQILRARTTARVDH